MSSLLGEPQNQSEERGHSIAANPVPAGWPPRTKRHLATNATKEKTTTYSVYVDDNFHFMREEDRYTNGVFRTGEEAIERCRDVLRTELSHYLNSGVALEELEGTWMRFGDDPWIKPDCGFSARTFVEEHCRLLRKAANG